MPGEQEIITVFVGCEDCGPTTDVIGLGAPHPAGGPTNWHCREHGRLLERLETVPSARVQELEGQLESIRAGKPYPNCWGDCGEIARAGSGAHPGYCCDGLWDERRRREAAESHLARLEEEAELLILSLLELLPVRGEWGSGYRLEEKIAPTLRAASHQWATAGHHLIELHRLLSSSQPNSATSSGPALTHSTPPSTAPLQQPADAS
jgi:hypothetical protein